MSDRAYRALKKFVKGNIPIQAIAARVTEIDMDNYTCTASPDEDAAAIPGIRLKPVIDSDSNGGLIVIPSIGSWILVGFLLNKDSMPFMIQWSKADSILIKTTDGTNLNLQGDILGGLVKVNPLKTGLTNNNNILNALMNVLTTWTPIAGDGGAALKTAMLEALSGKKTDDFSDIENTNIKQA